MSADLVDSLFRALIEGGKRSASAETDGGVALSRSAGTVDPRGLVARLPPDAAEISLPTA